MNNFRIVVFLLAIILNSCDSETDNSATDVSTGVLTGRVDLYDSEGSYVTDKQGVTVSIDGTNIRTTTTADGKWVINYLPAGIYDLTFEKPGYGYEKVYGFQFVGGGVAYFDLIDLSAEQLDKIKLEYFTISRYSGRLEVNIGGISPLSGTSGVLFVSTEKAKLLGEHHSDAEVAIWSYISSGQGNFGRSVSISEEEFFDTVSSGTMLYATIRILAHGENLNKFSAYFNPLLNKWVYTSAGPISEILADTVP